MTKINSTITNPCLKKNYVKDIPFVFPSVWSVEGPVNKLGVPFCLRVQSKLSPVFAFDQAQNVLASNEQSAEM